MHVFVSSGPRLSLVRSVLLEHGARLGCERIAGARRDCRRRAGALHKRWQGPCSLSPCSERLGRAQRERDRRACALLQRIG